MSDNNHIKNTRSAKNISELEILKKDPDFDINMKFSGRRNALFTANLEKSKWLIQNNINIHSLDNYSQNALFFVTSLDKLNLLIENGININKLNMYNRSFLFNMKPSIIEYIFSEKCNIDISNIINTPNNKNETFIYSFLTSQNLKNIDLFSLINNFIKKGGIINFKNKSNQYILNSLGDKPEMFIYLMENFQFDNIDEPYMKNSISSGQKYDRNLLCNLINHKDMTILDYLFNHKNKEFMNMVKYINNAPETSGLIEITNNYLSLKEKETISNSLTLSQNQDKTIIKRL